MLGPLLSVLHVSLGSHTLCVVGIVSDLWASRSHCLPLAGVRCGADSSCGPQRPSSWWRLISGTGAVHFHFLTQASDSCLMFQQPGGSWLSELADPRGERQSSPRQSGRSQSHRQLCKVGSPACLWDSDFSASSRLLSIFPFQLPALLCSGSAPHADAAVFASQSWVRSAPGMSSLLFLYGSGSASLAHPR